MLKCIKRSLVRKFLDGFIAFILNILTFRQKNSLYLILLLLGVLLLLRQQGIPQDNSHRDTELFLGEAPGYPRDEREFPGKRDVLESLQEYQRQLAERRARGDPQIRDVHKQIERHRQEQLNSESEKLANYIEGDEGEDTDEYIIYDRDYIASFQRFRVGQAKIKFLKEFQSPCFLENTTDPHPYSKSNMMQRKIKYKKKACFELGLVNKSRAAFVKLPALGRSYRLRCLPYFMMLGFAKCGSTDFQFRSVHNTHMVKGFTKEYYWWDQFRFTANASLSDYTDLFDSSLADLLKLKKPHDEYYPGVTGEMTTITMNSMAYWRVDPRNAGLKEPKYLTPHDLHSILPDVKLIVLMRNPVSRLYSHYNMWTPYRHHPVTPQDFHRRVVGSLAWWRNCTSILPVRNCLYGSPPEVAPVEHELSSWWPEEYERSGVFRSGLYCLFLQDWLEVFPREQFLFIQTEEYGANKVHTLNDIVYPFLNIPPVQGKEKEKLESMKQVFKQTYEPMLNETKQILSEFYQPYNDKLAQLLGDDKWKWSSS